MLLAEAGFGRLELGRLRPRPAVVKGPGEGRTRRRQRSHDRQIHASPSTDAVASSTAATSPPQIPPHASQEPATKTPTAPTACLVTQSQKQQHAQGSSERQHNARDVALDTSWKRKTRAIAHNHAHVTVLAHWLTPTTLPRKELRRSLQRGWKAGQMSP